MRIAICDNEQKHRKNLRCLCEKYAKENDILCKIYEFFSGKAILSCDELSFTLLFLDIELPDYNGIEVMKKLEHSKNIWRIILVSRHQEQVFSAFGVKTLDFCVKPVTYKQICHWMDIARKESDEDTLIKFNLKNPESWVSESQIIYIQAQGNYICVHTDKKAIIVSKNIKYWEDVLSDTSIARTHKSYLVNLAHILNIQANITLTGGITIPIGRKYCQNIKKRRLAFVQKQMQKRI